MRVSPTAMKLDTYTTPRRALALADDESDAFVMQPAVPVLRRCAESCAQAPARDLCLKSFSRTTGRAHHIAQNPHEQARGAEIEDIASILELIRPLEQSGTLRGDHESA